MPKFEMGELAARMLIRHIESKAGVPPQKVFLEAELVVRASTRPPPGQRAPARAPVAGAQPARPVDRDGRRSRSRDEESVARR